MFRRIQSVWWQAVTLVMSGVIATGANADVADSFSLARAPQRSEIATIRDWQPLADYFTSETKYQFQLKTYSSRADFEDSLIRGDPDFVFMSPYYHAIAYRRHGYIPLIRSSKELKGILVVRKDSPFKSVQDLQGKTFAFPSPNAFAASLYMRALLKEQEHIDFSPTYVETHDSVYRNVLVGRAAAGGGGDAHIELGTAGTARPAAHHLRDTQRPVSSAERSSTCSGNAT